MGDAANRLSQQSQQVHWIHGGSLQSTLNSPTSGALHTLHEKETRNTNHQRNQDYSPDKSSDNEVSVVLSFRASPNAFAPASLIPLSADTPEWGDPNTNSAIQSQWATLPTGNRNNRNNRNNRTRYMVVLIVVLHTPTLNSPTSGVLHTLQQQQPGNTNHRRNQDYSPSKFSDNELSVVLSFRASPNAFAPASLIPLSADTPEW
jgi:hypothetical protein